jgi:hypothetical protein
VNRFRIHNVEDFHTLFISAARSPFNLLLSGLDLGSFFD